MNYVSNAHFGSGKRPTKQEEQLIGKDNFVISYSNSQSGLPLDILSVSNEKHHLILQLASFEPIRLAAIRRQLQGWLTGSLTLTLTDRKQFETLSDSGLLDNIDASQIRILSSETLSNTSLDSPISELARRYDICTDQALSLSDWTAPLEKAKQAYIDHEARIFRKIANQMHI